ncbi:unnamed protein product [Urochloa humidicola]
MARIIPTTSGPDPSTKPNPEQVLADGDYELVPVGGEGQAEGEVNAVQVEQDPNPAAEEPQANNVPEEQVLADGDYELVPVGGEGQAEGEVNAVQVEQDPNPAAEEPQANNVPEGNPLEGVAANPWPFQLPPGWTVEWDTAEAE